MLRLDYEEFLAQPEALSFEDARRIYHMILQQHPEEEPQMQILFTDMIRKAIAYANYRAIWHTLSLQEQGEVDAARTMAHNQFISAVSKLAKNMYQQNKDIEWEDILGDNRKRIGDFACYVAYLYSVSAR